MSTVTSSTSRSITRRDKIFKGSLSPKEQHIPGPDEPDCICNREIKNIICTSCGFIFQGRARIRCMVHPTIIHLMDVEVCPTCQACKLREFSDAISFVSSQKRDQH